MSTTVPYLLFVEATIGGEVVHLADELKKQYAKAILEDDPTCGDTIKHEDALLGVTSVWKVM